MKKLVLIIFIILNIIASFSYAEKRLTVKFPDGFSTDIEKHKILKTSYIVKDGVRHPIEYYDEWINPVSGKLETFIKDDKIFRVIKTPVKNNLVYKEFNNDAVITKDSLKVPGPDAADNIDYGKLKNILTSNYKKSIQILTPEVSPEVSLTNSCISLKTASTKAIVLTDNIPYEFWSQIKIDVEIIKDVILKNIIWTFTNDDYEIYKFGNSIKIDEFKIPNLTLSDEFNWNLKLRIEVSIKQPKGFFIDFFLEKSFPLWIIDCTKPEYDIEILSTKQSGEKYKCSEFLKLGKLEIMDNNINLPDVLNDYKYKIFTIPEKCNVGILKTIKNISVSKNIDQNQFLASYSYFDIGINKKIEISQNYEGPFQIALQLSDITTVYTYEVISGEIIDDIPPFCEVMLNENNIVSKNDFNGKFLLEKNITISKKMNRMINQKRYKIDFKFFDNILYRKSEDDRIIPVNNIKSVFIDSKTIELNNESCYSTHLIMSKSKRIKLKIIDKNNNIRFVHINLSANNAELNITDLQE